MGLLHHTQTGAESGITSAKVVPEGYESLSVSVRLLPLGDTTMSLETILNLRTQKADLLAERFSRFVDMSSKGTVSVTACEEVHLAFLDAQIEVEETKLLISERKQQ